MKKRRKDMSVKEKVGERVGGLGARARERMMESRIAKLDRENERLKTEVGVLRQDLEEDRGALHEALAALRGRAPVTIRQPRRGQVIRTLVLAGGSYVLGTRAGRARYDQMKAWLFEAASRMRATIPIRGEDQASWEPSIPGSVPNVGTPSRG